MKNSLSAFLIILLILSAGLIQAGEKDSVYVLTDTVAFKDGYLVITITKPEGNGPFKSVFFIPGYTCFPVAKLGKHPYGQLLDGLTQKGYLTLRIEKPGMGESKNTPACDLIDFQTEVDAFIAGYKKLFTYDIVDKENVFIFGHSLGGIEAPIVALEKQPKGVIVCGTVAKTWYEYVLEMFRFQNIASGADFIENEKLMQVMIPMLFEYLVQKKTPLELSSNPEYKKALEEQMEFKGGEQIWSRHYSYWQGIQSRNIVEDWKNMKCAVLVIRGEGDFEAFSNTDHQMIADIVNSYNPGKGKFILIPNMDHGFAKAKTPQESLKNRQEIKGYFRDYFNPAIIEETDNWIKSLE